MNGCIELIVRELYKYYSSMEPETTTAEFHSRFIAPVLTLGMKSGERALTELLKLQDSGHLIDTTYAPMLIAVGWCSQALNEEKSGEHELALLALMEAKYWTGVMNAAKGVRAARDQTIRATRKATAAKAGRSKHSQLKQEAVQLAINRFLGKDQLSAAQMAREIVEDLRKRAEAQGLRPLTPGGDVDTVANWLLNHPLTKPMIKLRRRRPGAR